MCASDCRDKTLLWRKPTVLSYLVSYLSNSLSSLWYCPGRIILDGRAGCSNCHWIRCVGGKEGGLLLVAEGVWMMVPLLLCHSPSSASLDKQQSTTGTGTYSTRRTHCKERISQGEQGGGECRPECNMDFPFFCFFYVGFCCCCFVCFFLCWSFFLCVVVCKKKCQFKGWCPSFEPANCCRTMQNGEFCQIGLLLN